MFKKNLISLIDEHNLPILFAIEEKAVESYLQNAKLKTVERCKILDNRRGSQMFYRAMSDTINMEEGFLFSQLAAYVTALCLTDFDGVQAINFVTASSLPSYTYRRLDEDAFSCPLTAEEKAVTEIYDSPIISSFAEVLQRILKFDANFVRRFSINASDMGSLINDITSLVLLDTKKIEGSWQAKVVTLSIVQAVKTFLLLMGLENASVKIKFPVEGSSITSEREFLIPVKHTLYTTKKFYPNADVLSKETFSELIKAYSMTKAIQGFTEYTKEVISDMTLSFRNGNVAMSASSFSQVAFSISMAYIKQVTAVTNLLPEVDLLMNNISEQIMKNKCRQELGFKTSLTPIINSITPILSWSFDKCNVNSKSLRLFSRRKMELEEIDVLAYSVDTKVNFTSGKMGDEVQIDNYNFQMRNGIKVLETVLADLGWDSNYLARDNFSMSVLSTRKSLRDTVYQILLTPALTYEYQPVVATAAKIAKVDGSIIVDSSKYTSITPWNITTEPKSFQYEEELQHVNVSNVFHVLAVDHPEIIKAMVKHACLEATQVLYTQSEYDPIVFSVRSVPQYYIPSVSKNVKHSLYFDSFFGSFVNESNSDYMTTVSTKDASFLSVLLATNRIASSSEVSAYYERKIADLTKPKVGQVVTEQGFTFKHKDFHGFLSAVRKLGTADTIRFDLTQAQKHIVPSNVNPVLSDKRLQITVSDAIKARVDIPRVVVSSTLATINSLRDDLSLTYYQKAVVDGVAKGKTLNEVIQSLEDNELVAKSSDRVFCYDVSALTKKFGLAYDTMHPKAFDVETQSLPRWWITKGIIKGGSEKDALIRVHLAFDVASDVSFATPQYLFSKTVVSLVNPTYGTFSGALADSVLLHATDASTMLVEYPGEYFSTGNTSTAIRVFELLHEYLQDSINRSHIDLHKCHSLIVSLGKSIRTEYFGSLDPKTTKAFSDKIKYNQISGLDTLDDYVKLVTGEVSLRGSKVQATEDSTLRKFYRDGPAGLSTSQAKDVLESLTMITRKLSSTKSLLRPNGEVSGFMFSNDCWFDAISGLRTSKGSLKYINHITANAGVYVLEDEDAFSKVLMFNAFSILQEMLFLAAKV